MDSASSAGDGNGGGGVNSSSSDFVKKLFKMLEDPANREYVRWSDSGQSFIVMDNNDFTKKVLPQHFKHTNFASFVRQLNKYDFHKVRNNEEGAANQYGDQAWEFKHAYFSMKNRHNLENIKRKAPVSKNKQQGDPGDRQELEELQHRVRVVEDATRDISNKVQRMADQNSAMYAEFTNSIHQTLTSHQAVIQRHEQVLMYVLQHLHSSREDVQAYRRGDARHDHGHNGGTPGEDSSPNAAEELSGNYSNDGAPMLQQAQQLMNSQPMPGTGHDEASHGAHDSADANDGYGGVDRHPQNGQRPMNGMHNLGPASFGQESRTARPAGSGEVYQDSGQAGHLDYHTYPPQMQSTQAGQVSALVRPAPGRKRSTPFVPNWATPPRVLLVEDDPTCARIGSKFLASAQCACEIANDGLIAINMLNAQKFDLVLMDIMMPNLDGCSAAALIREFDQRTPIIAMTSNIKRDEINMYFNNGMNDVLPKPFTKEGLLTMLERILSHLKANKAPVQIPPQLSLNGPDTRLIEPDRSPAPPMSANSLKFSGSPAPSRSPGTAGIYGSSHSPRDMGEDPVGRQTPNTVGSGAGYTHMMGGYMESNGNPQQQGSGFSSPTNSSRGHRRRGYSELEDPEEQHMGYGEVVIKKQRF